MREDEAVAKICEGVLASGLRRGGTVLVHSSLSSMGHVPGGAETVILGLLEALGAEGTLLLPALSYRYVDMARPVFDVRKTPSNVGAVPEHFRTRQGTRRSVHPTHSVCGVGARAEEMLGAHHLDETPCGAHSPFRKLRDDGGQILFLGCGMRPNTSMHGVEELVEPPYLFGETVDYRAVLPDGQEIGGRCRRHNFPGWMQRYDRVAPLLNDGGLRLGRVLEADVAVVDCEPMWAQALAALNRNAFFFVERRQG